MSKCIECGAEVKQTEGRRPRKFCDNKGKCRLAHWNKNNPKAGKYVLKTTYDALEKQLKEVLSKGYDKDLLDKVEENNKPENKARILKERNTVNKASQKAQYPETARDPKEGSMAFYMKYDCYTYTELEKLKDKK